MNVSTHANRHTIDHAIRSLRYFIGGLAKPEKHNKGHDPEQDNADQRSYQQFLHGEAPFGFGPIALAPDSTAHEKPATLAAELTSKENPG